MPAKSPYPDDHGQLCRSRACAPAQRRADQALRCRRFRRHAQGRAAGRRVSRRGRGDHRGPACRPIEIDRFIYDFALAHDALPATLGYKGYMNSTCVSINHVVCHGIPGDKPLRDGDIANIDVTLIVDGWHGDSSRMVRSRFGQARRRTAGRGDLRGDDARHRRDQAGRHHRRHRLRDPAIRRGRALQRGARFLRPRRRAALPRRARTSCTTAAPATASR